jgi:Fe-S-cluster containining protein
MLLEQGVISGRIQESLSALRTAIASLKQTLETLPGKSTDNGDKRSPSEALKLTGESVSDGVWHHELISRLQATLPSLYAAYDDYLATVLLTEQRRVTCSRGCSACCRHYVSSVEPFELIALDHHLKSRPDYADLVVSTFRRATIFDGIVREESEKTDRNEEEAEDRALYRYFLRGHACPFLAGDGTCGVYDHRPMACRMFYAESAPRLCAGKELASPWNRNFQVELPQEAEEALARCSRLLEGLGLSEHLFTGLTEVNALFGQYSPDSQEPPHG